MVEHDAMKPPPDADEHDLWSALGDIEHAEPSAALRQGFYRQLAQASRPSPLHRLQQWLGLQGNYGWLTAAACVLLGFGIGQAVDATGDDAGARLAALEQDVMQLKRRLVLDRLESDRPSKRLRGVIDAGAMVDDDAQIAQALLQRATQDRVPSVRSAAIDALGPRIDAPAVGTQLMDLLREAQSPIVQLALVDMILRYGNNQQLDQLLSLAENDRLHPDLTGHVLMTLKGDVA